MTAAAIRMRAELVNLDLPHTEQIQQAHREYLNVSGATIAECGATAGAHAAALDGNWQVVGMEDGHGPTLAEAATQATQNTRPSASPVAEERVTAAGPSTPTAEPGRPTSQAIGGMLTSTTTTFSPVAGSAVTR